MTIRIVEQASDIERTAALAREIWTEHYTPLIGAAQVEYMIEHFQSVGAIRRAITDDNTKYYLAQNEQGLALGYAAAWLETDGRLFLSKLYIRRDARATGVGRALLKACIDACPQAKSVYLTVNKGNAGSIAAYRRMGFQVLRAVVTDIGGGFVMDDYVMEMPLSAQ